MNYYPKTWNTEKMQEKGFITNGKLNEDYDRLANRYRKVLEQYLLSLYHLEEVEKIMLSSGVNFTSLNGEDKTTYHNLASWPLLFFFIRNNISLEQLTSDDIELLRTENDDQVLMTMIKRTFPMVIRSNMPINIEGNYTLSYGTNTVSYFAPSNGLVLGLSYDSPDANQINDDEWATNRINQLKLMDKIKIRIENDFGNVLGIPVKIIEYKKGFDDQMQQENSEISYT